MDDVEVKILKKRQHLRDLLNVVLKRDTILLSLVKNIKQEIKYCDFILNEHYFNKTKTRII